MVIKGTHETPVKHYKDDISFTLTTVGSTGCSVAVSSFHIISFIDINLFVIR